MLFILAVSVKQEIALITRFSCVLLVQVLLIVSASLLSRIVGRHGLEFHSYFLLILMCHSHVSVLLHELAL